MVEDMKLNAAQYSQLRKYDRFLRTAHYANYITGMGVKTATELKDLYVKFTGKQYNESLTCGKCRLELCKRLGELYFSYIDAHIKSKENNEEQDE